MRQTTVKRGVLCVAMVLLIGPAALAEDVLKPSIFIPQLRHDFGQLFEQETYEHDFVIKNRGKADLVIEKVKPG